MNSEEQDHFLDEHPNLRATDYIELAMSASYREPVWRDFFAVTQAVLAVFWFIGVGALKMLLNTRKIITTGWL